METTTTSGQFHLFFGCLSSGETNLEQPNRSQVLLHDDIVDALEHELDVLRVGGAGVVNVEVLVPAVLGRLEAVHDVVEAFAHRVLACRIEKKNG